MNSCLDKHETLLWTFSLWRTTTTTYSQKEKIILGQHKEKNHSEITNELTEIFWYGLGVFFKIFSAWFSIKLSA